MVVPVQQTLHNITQDSGEGTVSKAVPIFIKLVSILLKNLNRLIS